MKPYRFLNTITNKINIFRKGNYGYQIKQILYIKNYLFKKQKYRYNDSDIREFHIIMSWLVIHKSTKLKRLASNKYLVCKYSKMKIGKNLCEQRICIFDNVEEIDFTKLKKNGNVILKISNGCNDSVLITNTTKESIEQIKEKITSYNNRNFSLIIPDFFHSISKKE